MHKNRIFLARKESNAFLRKKNKFFFALKIQRIFIGLVACDDMSLSIVVFEHAQKFSYANHQLAFSHQL